MPDERYEELHTEPEEQDDPHVGHPTIHVAEAQLCGLLHERKEMRAQVTALQTRMSELVNNTLARRVRAFMIVIKHPVLHTPQVPADDRVRLRLRLIAEEFFELLESSLVDNPALDDYGDIQQAHGLLMRALKDCRVRVDLPEFADALADLDYVIEGARAEFGINGGPVADEVHRTNMKKFWPGEDGVPTMKVRPDGKVLKPDDWTPPDIAGVLRTQGWQP